MREHQTQTITQLQMCRLLAEAYGKAATVENARSAFRGSGCWPVNRHVFKDCDFAGASTFEAPNEQALDEAAHNPTCMNAPTLALDDHLTLSMPSISRTGIQLLNTKNSDSSSSEVDNTDEDKDFVPISQKLRFEWSLLEISPIPRRHLLHSSRGGRTRGRPINGPQKAVLLTSSPYKLALEQSKEEKKKKEEEK